MTKQATITMVKDTNNKKRFDLEDRTTQFVIRVIRLCKRLPRNPINDRIIGQLAGSSGSIGANYREANDALGKKDFILRIKIARKESKEAIHWLELLKEANTEINSEANDLIDEAIEYKKILSSIIAKCV